MILFLVGRLRPSWRRTLLVAVGGFLGLVFEAVLILAYQAREGVLFQDIGLLLMMFMAGLAGGAWIMNEAIRWTGVRHKRSRWWGVGLLAGFGLLGIAAFGYVTGESSGGLIPMGGLIPPAALLAVAGFLVAGILAYASLYGIRDQKQVIATLYGADLLGGCLGSLLGSLVLIPFLGLDGTIKGMLALRRLFRSSDLTFEKEFLFCFPVRPSDFSHRDAIVPATPDCMDHRLSVTNSEMYFGKRVWLRIAALNPAVRQRYGSHVKPPKRKTWYAC